MAPRDETRRKRNASADSKRWYIQLSVMRDKRIHSGQTSQPNNEIDTVAAMNKFPDANPQSSRWPVHASEQRSY